jgi:type I restriction enzyme S subunit
MDSKSFFDNFETIANAPGGIARLRGMILNLAVNGKLTPFIPGVQDLSDTYKVPGISMDRPSHWGILSFEKHFDMRGGGQPPKSTFIDTPKENYIRLYQIRDYGPNPVPVFVPKDLAPRTTRKGDILIARYGASGKVFWAEEGAYNVALAKLLFPEDLYLAKYAYLMFSSGGFQQAVRGTTRVAVDGFNKNDLKNVYFPLPPLEEQHSIAEKVDKLMALCEELEAARNQRNAIRTAARKSAIDVISIATTPEELDVAWNRIRDNWLTIADTPESIASLRSLILDLAVRGTLTEQISNERRLEIPESDGFFEIPDNWVWSALEEIADYGGRGSKSPNEIVDADWVLDLEDIEKTTSRLLNRVRSKDRKTTSTKARFEKGDVLYGKLRPYLDKVLVADTPGYCTTEIVPITPKFGLDPQWLRISLKSPMFIGYVTEKSYGMKMPRLGTKDAKASLHAVPPIEEQKRIVTKVDELMELCDQLEHSLVERDELAKKIAGSLASEIAA